MRFYKAARFLSRLVPLLAVGLLLTGGADEARAQFVYKWLSVGDMHAYYTEAGSHNEDYNGHNVNWPGIRRESGNVRGYALWIGAKNFTDENGRTWPAKVAHVGPRITGVGEVFQEEFEMVSRFEPPKTYVDGYETIHRPVFNDVVDPNMKADRAIDNRVASVLGITLDRRVMQFSQEHHDDYHITEYTFTNTGNTDNDEEIELANQTLEGVYFYFQNRYAPNRSAGWIQDGAQGWGKFTMNDAVGDGHEEYDVDFRAQYSWLGNVPHNNDYETTVGGPVWRDNHWLIAEGDSVGRLGANHFIGKVYIHADGQAYPASTSLRERTDDPAQPSTMRKLWTGDFRTHLNSHEDADLMISEYELMSGSDLVANGNTPREYPHHADLVEATDGVRATKADFARQNGDPTLGQGSDGYAFTEGFGPYTMKPGESVKLVIAEAVAGLSDKAAIEIGRAYKRAKGEDDTIIDFDANGDGEIDPEKERMNKNLWVMTSKDSLFQVFERAIANYESGYNIPQPPKPPEEFRVRSGSGKITLEWTPYSGESPPGGWEVWRASGHYEGLPVSQEKTYRRVAALPTNTTSYEDTDVVRGLGYYYYVQAVGAVNNDPTGNTPTGTPLKSNRYYAQTYEPATLARGPGSNLEAVRVVPNPYNRQTAEAVRWDQADQLGFLDIPGNCTIRIYSEIGELLRTLRHDAGTGDAYWDMQTESQQLVVSGVYFAAITDEDSGDTIYRKFVIIR